MRIRHPLLATLIAAVVAPGCGDDSGESPGKPTAPPAVRGDANANAAAFIECFDKPGYEAMRPKPRAESVFAYMAKTKGFKVAAVNVSEKGMLSPTAYLAVFESPAEAQRAVKELNTTSTGEVKPQQKGTAVIGYLGPDDLKAVGPAVDACLT